jgi:predicted alpha-1,6-mannanase (GH76 family)
MHLTSDDSFPHLTQFYQNQPVLSLMTQKYDDKAWVVLTYLRAADYISQRHANEKWFDKMVRRARLFHALVRPGWDDKCCGGGMWWGPCTRYKNAVTTELFVNCSIGMYEIYGNKRDLERAVRGWIWFKNCGMINEEGLVNDGLTQDCRYPPEVAVPLLAIACFSRKRVLVDGRNNGQTTWTYNQGIILSGLSKLYKHTGDPSLLTSAMNLIDAVISSPLLVPSNNGILVESRDPTGTCDQDQWMFKGIFFQHLGYFLWDISNMQVSPSLSNYLLVCG